jgi:hypothetical protein
MSNFKIGRLILQNDKNKETKIAMKPINKMKNRKED